MAWGKTKDEEALLGGDGTPVANSTYIDHGCHLVGELKFSDNVRIDGHVEGEIRGEKSVIVGEEATLRARIHAENIIVHGTVEGDMFARGETMLHKSASVTGELQTGGIVVERGARLQGCITIGSSRESDPPTKDLGDAQNDWGTGDTRKLEKTP